MEILTFGYDGRRLESFVRHVEALQGFVLDIRIRPWSQNPEWREEALRAALGAQYETCGWWGNKEYKTGLAFRLVSFRLGLEQMISLAETHAGPIILLCRCRAETGCHRGHVAKRLRLLGHDVREMEWISKNAPLKKSRRSPVQARLPL